MLTSFLCDLPASRLSVGLSRNPAQELFILTNRSILKIGLMTVKLSLWA